MSETRLSVFKRVWTPSGAWSSPPATAYVRARVVNAVIAVGVLLLTPALFVSFAVLHQRSLLVAGVVVLAVSAASTAVLLVCGIRLSLHLGRWTSWSGDPIPRAERPVRFWASTAMCAAALAVYTTAAVALIWTLP